MPFYDTSVLVEEDAEITYLTNAYEMYFVMMENFSTSARLSLFTPHFGHGDGACHMTN